MEPTADGRPHRASTSAAHHLAAVLFADIAGHTAITTSDEDLGQLVRDELVAVARHEVSRHGGRLVKPMGDGVLVEFRGARQALHAALDMQAGFSQSPHARAACAALRIGLHLADVTELDGGDLHGADVSLASRVQSEASPGMVCVSAQFAAQLQSRPEFAFDCLGDRQLKGARGPMTLYAARWRGSDEAAGAPIAIGIGAAPRVEFLDVERDDHAELLDRSFEVYLELFPDEAERDSPLDIETWLREAARACRTGSPWREVYGVVHIGGDIAGMVYVSCHVERRWCFANYFGIRKVYRKENLASRVYDALCAHILQHVDPTSRGILFEVETVDFQCLEAASAARSLAECATNLDVLTHLRRLRRLLLYQSGGAQAFLDVHGRPLPYWQPALSEPLGPDNEVPLILMVMPFDQSGPLDVRDALAFVFDDLYGDAYGGAGSIEIPNYRRYVDGVKGRALDAAASGWSLGSVATKRQFRELLFFAKREGLYGHLDL